MQQWLGRTAALVGQRQLEQLAQARVALLGLGGVGGAAAEALVRSGVGSLLLVDDDRVEPTNLNRQMVATHQTLGMLKTQAAAQRLLAINPSLKLELCSAFYCPENSQFVFDYQPDVVLDAIDTLTAKIHLADACGHKDILLISCLGTGNRTDPTQVRVGRLSQTAGSGCPLARRMRAALRKLQPAQDPWVVYSTELPLQALAADAPAGRHSPASTTFVPNAAGLALAFAGVKLLLQQKEGQEHA